MNDDEAKSLPGYGERFPFVPPGWGLRAWVVTLFVREFVTAAGVVAGGLGALLLPARAVWLGWRYPAGRRSVGRFGRLAQLQWLILLAMHDVVRWRHGAEAADAFVRAAMQRIAPWTLAAIYRTEAISACEDPFEAFWSYNKAMFRDDPDFHVAAFEEEEDRRVMVVDRCAHCEIAQAFARPQLARAACDHDLTGFPAIAEAIQAEFRRPTTLAKDGAPCRFTFHRLGTAPPRTTEDH